MFFETIGGVHSPGPSGSTQADLFRPLRIPAILVGDSKLGGISSTISAFESLRIRGYDVECVLLFKDDDVQNDVYLTTYFQKFGIPCIAIRPPPERYEDSHKDRNVSWHYFDSQSRSLVIKQLMKTMQARHEDRIKSLRSMSAKAKEVIWYPSAQKDPLTPGKIMAIDSAFGDHFQTALVDPVTFTRIDPRTLRKNTRHKMQTVTGSNLRPTFDGSASWWTKGLGHANPQLTLAAAYAAGRYGHVTSAEAIHQPGLQLAKTLLQELNNPRLSRVFYSDNEPASVEVAVKMALRAARLRYGWGPEEKLGILGLKDSYHENTMGATHSDPGQQYGQGHWLDFPTVKMSNGEWLVDVPEALFADDDTSITETFLNLEEIFDVQSRSISDLAEKYSTYITRTLEEIHEEGHKLGALMLEPVVLGAGGMTMVDPLFQRVLVDVVRSNTRLFSYGTLPARKNSNDWTGLPVVFDEGLTGLYRLGRYSSAKFLGIRPDISVHGKLLTGGLAPLVATVASESIFDSFESHEEIDALLQNHSYTAHPVGCQTALQSLSIMDQLKTDGAWSGFQSKWAVEGEKDAKVWSVWGQSFVKALSMRTEVVEGVWALGSVLAIHFQDADDAAALQAELMSVNTDMANSDVHCQVSGNVLYMMASQISELEMIEGLEARLLRAKAVQGDLSAEEETEEEEDDLLEEEI